MDNNYHPFEKDSSFVDYSQRQLRPQQVSVSELNNRAKTHRGDYRKNYEKSVRYLGERKSTRDILGIESKDLLSPLQVTEDDIGVSMIWKKFKTISEDLKPDIREIIDQLALTIVESSHCLLDLFNLFSRPEIIDDVKKKGEKIEKLAKNTAKACSLFKIELAQLIRQSKEQLKYQNNATLEEISMISEKMMKHNKNNFRPNFMVFKEEMIDITKIVDPGFRVTQFRENNEIKDQRKRSQIYIEPAMEDEHNEFKKSNTKPYLNSSDYTSEGQKMNYASGPKPLKNSKVDSYTRSKRRIDQSLKYQEKISRSSPARDASLVKKSPHQENQKNIFVHPVSENYKFEDKEKSSISDLKNANSKTPLASHISRDPSVSSKDRKTSDFLKAKRSLTPSPKRNYNDIPLNEVKLQRSKTPKVMAQSRSFYSPENSKERERVSNDPINHGSFYSIKANETSHPNLTENQIPSTRRSYKNQQPKQKSDAPIKKRYQSKVSQSNFSNYSEIHHQQTARDLSSSSTQNKRKSKSLKRKRMSKANYLNIKNKKRPLVEEKKEYIPVDSEKDLYELKNFFGMYTMMNPAINEIDCKPSILT